MFSRQRSLFSKEVTAWEYIQCEFLNDWQTDYYHLYCVHKNKAIEFYHIFTARRYA